MAEKMSEVYEMYDVQTERIGRGRGAMVLYTDKGVRQVRPVVVNDSRIQTEYECKERLFEAGYIHLDRIVKNKEGELITYDRYGNPFVMRMYFEGREMNVTNRQEILMAVDNLVAFHCAGKEAWRSYEGDMLLREKNDLRRRNRELKRIIHFVSKQSPKREFEALYMKAFPYFYEQGLRIEQAQETALSSPTDGIYDSDTLQNHIGYCHGVYNHHSVLLCSNNDINQTTETNQTADFMATINFDRFHVGNQLQDLYYFMRKTVEKNGYSFDLMLAILQQYHKGCPLRYEDIQYIYRLYQYPEKFYKLSNQYMNSNKNRISPKMVEKLNRIIEEEEQKQELLEKMHLFTSHLNNYLV